MKLFGVEVLKKCTPLGTGKEPGLPIVELNELKQFLFSKYPSIDWSAPEDFESVWTGCCDKLAKVYHLIVLSLLHLLLLFTCTLST